MGGLARLKKSALRHRAAAEGVKDFKPLSRAAYDVLPEDQRAQLDLHKKRMGPGAVIYKKPDGGFSVLAAAPQSLDDFIKNS